MIYEHEHWNALRRISEFESWKGIERTRFDGQNFRCRVPTIVRFAKLSAWSTRHTHSRKRRADFSRLSKSATG